MTPDPLRRGAYLSQQAVVGVVARRLKTIGGAHLQIDPSNAAPLVYVL